LHLMRERMPSRTGSPSKKATKAVRFEDEKKATPKRDGKEQDGDAPTSTARVSRATEKTDEAGRKKWYQDGDYKPPASAKSPTKAAEEGRKSRKRKEEEVKSPPRPVRIASIEGSIKRISEIDSEEEPVPSSSTAVKPVVASAAIEKKRTWKTEADEDLPTSSTAVSRRKKKRDEEGSESRSPKRSRRVASGDRMDKQRQPKEDVQPRSQSADVRKSRRKETNEVEVQTRPKRSSSLHQKLKDEEGEQDAQSSSTATRDLPKREHRKPKKYDDEEKPTTTTRVTEEKPKRAYTRKEKVDEIEEIPSDLAAALRVLRESRVARKTKATQTSDDEGPSTSAKPVKRKYTKKLSAVTDGEEDSQLSSDEAKPKRAYVRKPKVTEEETQPNDAKKKRKHEIKLMDTNLDEEDHSSSSEAKPKRKYVRKPKDGEKEAQTPSNEDKPKRKYIRKPKLEDAEEKNNNQTAGDADDEEDEHFREKLHGVHYPGKVYVMNKHPHKKDEPEKKSRVERILEGANEDEDVWDARATEMYKKKQPYQEDFVAGCTDPGMRWDSPDLACMLLVVYQGFPRGEWLEYSWANTRLTPEILDFVNMQRAFDKVEDELKEECGRRGLKFERHYSARYLPRPPKKRVYGTTKLEVLRTFQMARQNDIYDQCKEDGVPPIYIADWSGELHDFATSSINNFKFSNYPVLSKRIRRAFDTGNIERMDEHCRHGCSCSTAGVKSPCTCNSKRSNKLVRFECSDYCKCGSDCSSRIVQ
ncbi:hypothetical protein PMAYCL1PPCAC_01011, partial [Pristionchus mayeri]